MRLISKKFRIKYIIERFFFGLTRLLSFCDKKGLAMANKRWKKYELRITWAALYLEGKLFCSFQKNYIRGQDKLV